MCRLVFIAHVPYNALSSFLYPRVLVCPTDWLDLDKVRAVAPELLNHTHWPSSLLAFRRDAQSVEQRVSCLAKACHASLIAFVQHHEHDNTEDSYRHWLEASLRNNYTKLKDFLIELSRDTDECAV